MRKIIAYLLKFIFKIKPLRKYYFGFYKRIIKPKNLFKGIRIQTYLNGIQFNLKIDDWIQQNIFLFGEYEMAEYTALEKLLKNDAVFIDIGANIGLYSLCLARKLTNGQVYGFEPFSVNYSSFSSTAQKNNITNVTCLKLAVGENSVDEIKLYYDASEKNLGMVSVLQNGTKHLESVPMISIDDFVVKYALQRIDAIKIDVEGFELSVIKGMKNVLETYHPALLIEILDENNDATKEVLALIYRFGYTKFFISDNGELTHKPLNINRKNYIFK